MGHYIQIRGANIGVTYTGGWCLKAVQDAFGTPHIYASATDDWNSGEHNGDTSLGNHDGELPPSGVQVPVYLYLNNVPEGDVAISQGDGTIAAAAQSGTHNGLFIYSSLQAYINDYARYNGGATYRGWSEGTANTRVVQYQPDITTQNMSQVDSIPFNTQTQDDPLLTVGQSKVVQEGVNGTHTVITQVTYSDGVQSGSTVVSDTTIPPTPQITANGTAPVVTLEPPVTQPIETVPPVTVPDPTVPKPWYQPFVDFLIYIFKNIIAGVK